MANKVIARVYNLRVILIVIAKSTIFSIINLGNVFLIKRIVLSKI